jgi:hypothetical protein
MTGQYGRDTWQHGRETSGSTAVDMAMTWSNQGWTRVQL